MQGPAELYDDRLPPELRGRLTAEEAFSCLKRNQAPLYEQHETARLERLRIEGNRKIRKAAEAELRARRRVTA